jgi:hypothetical protein
MDWQPFHCHSKQKLLQSKMNSIVNHLKWIYLKNANKNYNV